MTTTVASKKPMPSSKSESSPARCLRDRCLAAETVVRPARPDEGPLLSTLALRSKAHWGYSQAFLDACRKELSYPAALIEAAHVHAFVLKTQEHIAGFYVLEQRSDTSIELAALFLEPHYIGKGYGRLLIEHAKRTAAALRATHMWIQGDPHAEAFYRAAGGIAAGRQESGSIPGRFLPVFVVELQAGEAEERKSPA